MKHDIVIKTIFIVIEDYFFLIRKKKNCFAFVLNIIREKRALLIIK